MKLPSAESLSVRGLATAGLAALALLCLVVAGGVAWVATLLQSTSTALLRESDSLQHVTQVEVQLLNFQRIAARSDDPAAQRERRVIEQELRESLLDLEHYASSPPEVSMVDRSAAAIALYLDRRAEVEQTTPDPRQVQLSVRPLLNEALGALHSLRQVDETEMMQAHDRAQRVGAFLRPVSLVIIALTAALLLLMVLAVRRLLLGPILDIREAIERFRAGEPFATADERAPRELREIAKAFNDMSTELGRQKAQQLAFIAGVAHDLRNPLAALQFGLDGIRQDWRGSTPETKQTMEVLGRQLDQLARMVNDLLETCYIEAGELVLAMDRFDLRDAAKAVVDLYRPLASNRKIAIDLGDRPALVHADRMRIEQVIGNLLNNAIKYSAEDSPIRVDVSQRGDAAELTVADQGIGISKEDMENIFLPFWRADKSNDGSSTGLGLSVVRKIVAAHGGTIGVDSTRGAGSAFRVRLPAAAHEQRRAVS